MIEIALSPCLSVSKPFAAGAKEQVSFVGADVADGMQIALYDSAGTVLALADVASGGATLDLDTQEAFAALDGVPVGGTVPVWCIVGDADTHIATLPARLILNALDTNAHPPAPVPDIVKQVAEALKAAQAAAEAAKTSEDEAAKSAQGAQAAQEAAEGAAQAAAQSAQAAQTAATTASSAATVSTQRAAEANARAGEAANSAVAADDAAGRAYGAQTAAEAAKTAAETAKTAAEAAKTAAETSSSTATQKATEAAASAQEALETAAGLKDALVQVSGLEGRVAKLEDGKGVYVDEDGNVQIYTPLPDCPDGTLKVVKDMPNMKKIGMVGFPDTNTFCVGSDGDYIFVTSDVINWWNSNISFWVYDKTLTRVLKLTKRINNGYSTNRAFGLNGTFCTLNGALYSVRFSHKTGPTGALGGINKWLFSDGDAAPGKFVYYDSPTTCNSTYIAANPLTDHLLLIFWDSYDSMWHIWPHDEELNRVVGDDGEPLDIAYSGVSDGGLGNFRKHYGRLYSMPLRADSVGYLHVFDENDTPSIVRESLLQEDPDRPGKLLCERDADGNIIRDDPGVNAYPRPITSGEGREIKLRTKIEDGEYDPEKDAALANCWHCNGAFCTIGTPGEPGSTAAGASPMFTDGLVCYCILKDGRFVNVSQTGNFYSRGNGTGEVSYVAPRLTVTRYSDSRVLSKQGDMVFSCGSSRDFSGSDCVGTVRVVSNPGDELLGNMVGSSIGVGNTYENSLVGVLGLSVSDIAYLPGTGFAFCGRPAWFFKSSNAIKNTLQ